jgi:perosamine synthetase
MESSSPSLEQFTVSTGVPVSEALLRMNENLHGIVFVVRGETLLGVATDGDIRRGFLAGRSLGDSVDQFMNESPTVLPSDVDAQTAYRAVSAGKSTGRRVLPRIDHLGRLVGYASVSNSGAVPMASPVFGDEEVENLLSCIESGWISSGGAFVEIFERSFGDFVGLSNGLAVSSGTSALELALLTLGVGPGDEVIVPDITFGATANSVLAVGAHPVFCEVDANSLGISRESVAARITSRTRAVIAVHLYGEPCDVVSISDLCSEFELHLIEDCAEAIGTRLHNGAHVGTQGRAATFSFFANKTITTGEGGMVFFAHSDEAERARLIRSHGMSPERRYWHEVPGRNYRMTNLQAAIGVAQCVRLPLLVEEKQRLADAYRKQLAACPGLTPVPISSIGASSYWVFPVLLDSKLASSRALIREALALNGIETRDFFAPLSRMPAFAVNSQPIYPVAEDLAYRGLCLPCLPTMSLEDVAFVARNLEEAVTDQLRDLV